MVSIDWLCEWTKETCGKAVAKILTVLDWLIVLLVVFIRLRKMIALVQSNLPRLNTKMVRLKARLVVRRAIWKKPQFEAASGDGDLSAYITEVVKNRSIVNSLQSSR